MIHTYFTLYDAMQDKFSDAVNKTKHIKTQAFSSIIILVTHVNHIR